MLLSTFWGRLLARGLEEDGHPWDWTAMGALGPRLSRRMRARVVARSAGVWAAAGLVEELRRLGLDARSPLKDGARVRPGAVVARIAGPAGEVLAAERPFLNLAAYAGGIATATRELVDIARRACPRGTPRITSTRKILPAYRDLAIHAVQAGGGHSHRVSLSGGVLIKENHVAAAGSIARAVEGARARAPHGLKIEVEVRTLAELRAAARAGADAVLLDNFTPAQVRAGVREAGRALVEVSGGLTAGNLASYAIPGVHVLSVGSLTHTVRSLDLSLLAEGT
jgi:nicotinate-nucleotide pyrophosphorylase (carboxylating)